MKAKIGEYFPHYVGARNDLKIKLMIAELGIQSYAYFFIILEFLAEVKDNKLSLADLEKYCKAENLDFKIALKVVRDYELFIYDGERFYSELLLSFYRQIRQRQKAGRLGGIKRTKANETKANEIKTSVEFEELWQLYDKPTNKTKAYNEWCKLNGIERLQALKSAKTFVEQTPDVKFRPDLHRFLSEKRFLDGELTKKPMTNDLRRRLLEAYQNKQNLIDGEIEFYYKADDELVLNGKTYSSIDEIVRRETI